MMNEDPAQAPLRDPLYAPRRLEVERRAGGETVLTNPTPFSDRFQTQTAPLEHWASLAPDRTWLAERSGDGWRTVSYSEGRQRVAALAAGLAELGLAEAGAAPARPLLILAGNGVDHALIAYAAMSQGVPVAPVSAQYGLPGANLARLTHACHVLNPAAVFTDDAALQATGLGAPALAGLPVIAARNPRPGDIPLERLYRAGERTACARPDDHAKYLLTSGSTGLPKAVICTHRTISLNSAQITACFVDPDPPVLVNGSPWSHSLGGNSVLHQALHRGGSLYIDAGAPTAARFGETLRNLSDVSPTYQNMVPAAWALLAEALDADPVLARRFFARIRILQYGGAALGQATCDRIEAAAVRTVGERITFAAGYGATETGPTACNVHWPNQTMGLIGLPIPGTSVRLVPRQGKLEFRVRGPQVSPGYLGRPELTASVFDDEGFYILGDAARFHDPEAPEEGLVFDGRVAENFKLANGTFVSAGDLRLGVVAEVGCAVSDAVVCGEGQAVVGLLFYPSPAAGPEQTAAAVRQGVAAFNAASGLGVRGRIARALVLDGPPDAAAGEITEKGNVSQVLARQLRAADVARLFATPPDPAVMLF
jgi:feruloyl-CoA synthase